MLNKITLLFLLLFISIRIYAEPLHIVAAENFYGQVAQTIGGQYVEVNSLLTNPKQDPHLFSTTPKTAKAVAHADLIIYNGLAYDPWMENLIQANSKIKPIIVVAELLNKKNGDNPHIWYDPNTMLIFATYLTQQLSKLDSAHQNYFQQQLILFKKEYQSLIKQITADKIKFQNTPVIATEPIFNDMANALGLTMYGLAFQRSIMNNTEPSAADIKDFQDHLTLHQVKVLITNNQVSDPLTERMQQIAEKSAIPCVSVSEMQPLEQDYITWMSKQLTRLEKALGETS